MNASRSLAWLWLVVAIQVAIPASYYLRERDLDDERFAWRMFSNVRIKRCRVRAFTRAAANAATELKLATSLHSSWIHGLERGRMRVIERYLATRCTRLVTASLLERRCQDVRAAERAEHYLYDCQTRRLSVRGP